MPVWDAPWAPGLLPVDVELGNEVLDGSKGEFWLKTFDVQVS